MVNKIKILVTPDELTKNPKEIQSIFGDNYEIDFCIDKLNEHSKIILRLRTKNGAILGQEEISEEIINSCPNLKIFSRFGIGYDKINIEAATRKCVKVAITYNIAYKAVAMQTVDLLLSLAYNIKQYQIDFQNNKWSRYLNFIPQGKVLGIIGLGNIGLETALLVEQLGFQVAYFSRTEKKSGKERGYTYYKNVEELIAASDIVSLHLSKVNLL